MRTEIRFVPTGQSREVIRRNLDPRDLDGYHLQELDVAAVQITTIEQMDQVLDYLIRARECFRGGAKQIEPKFDEHEDITGQTNSHPGDRRMLPDGKL